MRFITIICAILLYMSGIAQSGNADRTLNILDIVVKSQANTRSPIDIWNDPKLNISTKQDIKSFDIYSVIYGGVPDITPTYRIKATDKGLDIYGIFFGGAQTIIPIMTLKPASNGSFNAYEYWYGVPNMIPSQVIKPRQ